MSVHMSRCIQVSEWSFGLHLARVPCPSHVVFSYGNTSGDTCTFSVHCAYSVKKSNSKGKGKVCHTPTRV